MEEHGLEAAPSKSGEVSAQNLLLNSEVLEMNALPWGRIGLMHGREWWKTWRLWWSRVQGDRGRDTRVSMEDLSCSVKSRKKEVEGKIKETKKKPPETGRGWRDGCREGWKGLV